MDKADPPLPNPTLRWTYRIEDEHYYYNSPHFAVQSRTIAHPTTPRVRLRRPLAVATTTHSYTSRGEVQAPHPRTFWNSNRMASCTSLYEVLGIPRGATNQEIKTAYRRLARICHPDVVDIHRRDSSADEFIKIHSAYCTLSDPAKRAVYDQNLFRRRRPLTTTMSRYSGYSGRNWETDQCW